MQLALRAIIRLVPIVAEFTVVDVAVTAGLKAAVRWNRHPALLLSSRFVVGVPCLEVSSANVVPTGGGCSWPA